MVWTRHKAALLWNAEVVHLLLQLCVYVCVWILLLEHVVEQHSSEKKIQASNADRWPEVSSFSEGLKIFSTVQYSTAQAVCGRHHVIERKLVFSVHCCPAGCRLIRRSILRSPTFLSPDHRNLCEEFKTLVEDVIIGVCWYRKNYCKLIKTFSKYTEKKVAHFVLDLNLMHYVCVLFSWG